MTGSEATYGEVRHPNRAPRDTTPGHRSMVNVAALALLAGGYQVYRDVYRESMGLEYRLTILAKTPHHPVYGDIPVRLMWQSSGGSAEEKVPYHLIHLGNLAHQGYLDMRIRTAYLVLDGAGWRPELRRAYLGGAFNARIHNGGRVRVVTLDEFSVLAETGEL